MRFFASQTSLRMTVKRARSFFDAAWWEVSGTQLACILACCSFFPALTASASPAPPDRREIWVPAEQLKSILAKDPKAVLLSREQYETLLRDAKADRKTLPQPPVPAVVTSATYTGRIEQNTLQLHGEIQVDVLSDRWTEVPFRYQPNSLGAVRCDGETALCGNAPDGKAPASPHLLVRGKGAHRIGADFSFHVDRRTDGDSAVELVLPEAVAGVAQLELPPNVKVTCDKPFRQTNGTASTSLTLAAADLASATLSWHSGGARQVGDAVVSAEGSYLYFLDAERVRADFGLVLNASLGKLPQGVTLVVPEGAKVLQVEGAEVLKWSLVRDRIEVQFAPGERTVTAFRAVLETPSLRQGAKADVALPVPALPGIGRVSGVFALMGTPGVSVRDVKTDALTVQTFHAVDPAIERNPDFIAAYRFPAQPEPPHASVSKIVPRFDADLDTLAEFRQDGISIERTVALRQREGEVFEAAIVLPKAEELLSVRTGSGAEPEWRTEGGRVLLRWSDRLPAGQPRVFKLCSRTEPEKWTQLPAGGLPVTLEDAVVEKAGKVTGYVALRSDASFRLEKIDAGTMEQRDGRKTPVKGDFAWFRGREAKLALTVAKRPGELHAAFTGYALPMEDVLDVRAQIDFDARYSGVKSVRIQVPAALAAQFKFEGPQIAERKLEGDTWVVSFQKEIVGHYRLAVSVQAPVSKDPADSSRFTVEVPRIVPKDVQRASGAWAIEANTETEISFAASGMNELDSLLAPPMANYQPRHRVIGVFQFMGDAPPLKLTAVRHASAPILTTVVDEMTLDTVVTSGAVERHQARLALRTAGEQYLLMTLPDRFRLISLTVDDEPVKPVGTGSVLRVQLPAKRDTAEKVRIAVLYETPKREWRGSGRQELIAPKLSAAIPVLKSQWRVFVPDGYAYGNIESNLEKQTEVVTPLLVEKMWGRVNRVIEWLIRNGVWLLGLGALILCWRFLGRAETWAQRWLYILGFLLVPIIVFLFGGMVLFSTHVEEPDFSGDSANFVPGSTTVQVPPPPPPMAPPAKCADRPGTPAVALNMPSPLCVATEAPNSQALAINGNAPAFSMPKSPIVRQANLPQAPLPQASPKDGAAQIQERLNTIIPKVEFRDATVREAIDFLRSRVPVDIVLDVPGLEVTSSGTGPASEPAISPNEARITFSLSNMPAAEVLRYITSLSGLTMKIERDRVRIVPLSVVTDQLLTKEFLVPPGFLGPSGQADAKAFLEANGANFPVGASAVYYETSNRLVVRNTQDNLDLIESLFEASRAGLEQPPTTAGLLPMKLDLPLTGRPLVFQGFYAPGQVRFGYVDWRTQARHGWLWFAAGAAVFLAFGRKRPWRRSLWAALILSFYPLCLAASATAVCNALLAGWLAGLVLERFAAWVVFREPDGVLEGKAVGV